MIAAPLAEFAGFAVAERGRKRGREGGGGGGERERGLLEKKTKTGG